MNILFKMMNCYIKSRIDFYGSSLDEQNKVKNTFVSLLEEFQNHAQPSEIIDNVYWYVFNEMEDENITYNSVFHLDEHEYSMLENGEKIARIYLLLLLNFIEIVKERAFFACTDIGVNFIYQPPNLFKRISNQQGIFVYQPYLYEQEDIYNFHFLNTQEINPDIKIEIDNYNTILEELNALGINLEFIYNGIVKKSAV